MNKKKYLYSFVVIILGFVLFYSAYVVSQSFLINENHDFFAKLALNKQVSQEIVVVTIDDDSLYKIGRWPWKRTIYADLCEFIEKQGQAKTIVFDAIITSYADKEDDNEFFKRLSSLKTVVSGVSFIKRTPSFYSQSESNLNEILKERFSISVLDNRSEQFRIASEYLYSSYSLEEMLNLLSGIGSVNSIVDKDRVIRKFEPIVFYKGSYYPSLAIAVYLQIYPDAEFILNDDFLVIKNNEKEIKMPLESTKDGSFSYIQWNKADKEPFPYKTISAWKVIESYKNIQNEKAPVVSPNLFKDKIVLIGSSATALNDIKSTPFSVDFPGVYIQATLIDNILNNQFIKKTSKGVNLAITIFMAIVAFVAVLLFSPLISAISVVFMAVFFFNACVFASTYKGLILDGFTPLIFMACAMLIAYAYKYFSEYKQKQEIKKLMGKYVSDDVMEKIISDRSNLKLGGIRSEVTILMIDIRKFTCLSDCLEPEELSFLLNEYFGEMVPIIFKNKGTVNKFVGDAILVIFGAPVETKDHAKDAVRCALEMLDKVKELSEKWQKEKKHSINVGIGISTGVVFVGNIGSDLRMEYSAIGRTVNVASRLESFNKLYKTEILISECTYEVVKDIVNVKEVDSVCVTQNSKPMTIYELESLKDVHQDR